MSKLEIRCGTACSSMIKTILSPRVDFKVFREVDFPMTDVYFFDVENDTEAKLICGWFSQILYRHASEGHRNFSVRYDGGFYMQTGKPLNRDSRLDFFAENVSEETKWYKPEQINNGITKVVPHKPRPELVGRGYFG